MQCLVQVRESGVSADKESYRQNGMVDFAPEFNILGSVRAWGKNLPDALVQARQTDRESAGTMTDAKANF